MGKKVKKAILFYGEGLVGEKVFLTHVKNLCQKNNRRLRFKHFEYYNRL